MKKPIDKRNEYDTMSINEYLAEAIKLGYDVRWLRDNLGKVSNEDKR